MRTTNSTTGKIANNGVSLTILLVLVGTSTLLLKFEKISLPAFIVFVILSLLISSSINIAYQWEKAIVLRMGKFIGLRGPGFFMIIPIIDRVSAIIDQRVRVTDIKAEETLTRDTVPVNVDAVVYWTVWDAEKAALEVQDYENAIFFISQTTLRDIIGKHELADLLQEEIKLLQTSRPYWTSIQTPGELPVKM
jgi:regulator of protease activity HflC (stomatin/prohibitin superfamily)